MRFEDLLKEKIQDSRGTITLATALKLCTTEFPGEHEDYIKRVNEKRASDLTELKIYSYAAKKI